MIRNSFRIHGIFPIAACLLGLVLGFSTVEATTTQPSVYGMTPKSPGTLGSIQTVVPPASSWTINLDSRFKIFDYDGLGSSFRTTTLLPGPRIRRFRLFQAGNDCYLHGRPYVQAIGLYDHRARFYDPGTLSFLQPDPLGPVDSPNLYQAFGFDSFNVTDPFGLTGEDGTQEPGFNIAGLFMKPMVEAYIWGFETIQNALRTNDDYDSAAFGRRDYRNVEDFIGRNPDASSASAGQLPELVRVNEGAKATAASAWKSAVHSVDAADRVFAGKALLTTAFKAATGFILRVTARKRLRNEALVDSIVSGSGSEIQIGKFLEGEDVAEAGAHASKVGEVTGVVDRGGAASRRRANLKGKKTAPGMDRDEYPPAVIKPDDPAVQSVELIPRTPNRRSGGRLRGELPPDGTRVRIIPPEEP